MSSSFDGRVIVWNAYARLKEQLVTLKVPWIMACAFAPSSRYFACGGLDNVCSVFSCGVSDAKHELRGHDGYVSGIRFVDDGKLLTSSGDMACRLWDVDSGRVISTFLGHRGDVSRSGDPLCPVALRVVPRRVFSSLAVIRVVKLWTKLLYCHCLQY